jgi:hypothetical protein
MHLFAPETEESAEEERQERTQEEPAPSEPMQQEATEAPRPLPIPLPQELYEELKPQNEARHDWIEQLGAQDRSVTSKWYQRGADLRVSTTDPDASLMLTKDGAHLGYHTHYVVDGGKSRIILQALVTPSEVMDNQPMLDLLWRVRFRTSWRCDYNFHFGPSCITSLKFRCERPGSEKDVTFCIPRACIKKA